MRGAGRAGAAGPGPGHGPGPVTSESLPTALAWFSKPSAAQEEEERQGAGGAAGEDAADEAEAEIIQLLKQAKVRRPCCSLISSVGDRLDGGSEGKTAWN